MSRAEVLANSSPKFSPEMKEKIKATRRFMGDMLVIMAVASVMAWYYYGTRVFSLILVSVLTAVVTEYFGSKIFHIDATLSDLSAVTTGVAIALCLPASSPLWLPCSATFFAILVVKLPFGNARSVLFSPAAGGLAFVSICMPEKVFLYPAILGNGEVAPAGTAGFVAGSSVAKMLSQKNSIGINIISYIDVLVGNVAGPMGATCALLMFGALLYLAIRRPKSFTVSGSFLLVCFLYAILFPRVLTGRMISAFMELCGGMLLFSAVFLLPNENLIPKKFYARLCYGAVAGLLCMLMRTFGTQEEAVVFAILIANGLVNAFDKLPLAPFEKKAQALKKAEAEKEAQEREEQERIENLVSGEIQEVEEAPAETVPTAEIDAGGDENA